MLRSANPFKHIFPVELRKYVFRRRNVEKHRSFVHVDTGSAASISSKVNIFGIMLGLHIVNPSTAVFGWSPFSRRAIFLYHNFNSLFRSSWQPLLMSLVYQLLLI